MSYWTEKIPVDWEMETLDKSVSNIVDNRGRTAPTAKSGIPLIATNCIKEFGLYPVFEKVRYIDQDTFDNWFRGHPEPNDILFVNKGTPGGACIVPDPVPFCIAQDMVALRADPKKFDWKYLFAAIRSDFVKSQIEALNVGTSIPHLKKTDFNRIVIPKPTYEDQVAIGEIYFSLSLKIELNLQMNKTLEEMAMALYKHWFVDFGPFQDEEFVDSELGEIPKGWEVKNIKEIAEVNSKSISKNAKLEIIEYIDIASVGEGWVENIQPILFSEAPSRARRIISDGDIVWSTVRPNRKSRFLALGFNNRTIVSTGFAVTSPKTVPYSFLYPFTCTENFVDYLISRATGSSYPAVTGKIFEEAKLVVPTQNILEKYNEIAEPLYLQFSKNNIENQTLTQLRDTLLPKLISGEVRLKEAEKTLTEVL